MARSRLVARLRVAFSVALLLALAGFVSSLGRTAEAQTAEPSCGASGPPTLGTDKPTYAFNEIAVVLDGGGYGCGAELQVRVTRPDGVADTDVATTDAAGHLSYEYWISAGAGEYVADVLDSDGASVLASTTFTWSSVMVLSDKTDYVPGETVTIFGADWAPGESVELHLQVDPKTHEDLSFLATADERGDFVNQEYVVQESDLGVTFLLRALGQSSGFTAQTTFTDHTGLFFSTFGGAAQNTVTVDGWVDSDAGGGDAVVISEANQPRSATNLHYARLRNGASVTNVVSTVGHDSIHLKFFCRGDIQATATDQLRVFVDLNGDGDFGDANEGPHVYSLDTAGTTGNACPDSPANTWTQKDLNLSGFGTAVDNNPTVRVRFVGATVASNRRALVDDVEVTGADTCGNGVVEPQYGEQCDGGAANGTSSSCCTSTCQAKSAGSVCRASAGACDVVETCSGSSGECPVDGFAAGDTVCNPANGACDVAEVCSGSSAECPADAVVTAGTECRGAAGECDVAESCDGSAKECPADALKPANEECRASAGECDVAESCSGTSAACPVDGFQPATEVCRGAEGVCDVSESCTGSDAACPTDAKSTAECRGSAGVCDVAESCDGVGNDCPVDAFVGAGTECRGSAGVCDPAEQCTGSAAACPVDGKSTALCRGSAGECDVAESCDGINNDCPVNGFLPSSVTCRGSAGVCDPAETCTGSGASCPVDGKSTAECRGAAGACDVAESCDGVNDDCPLDDFVDAGTECRGAAGECDVAESCSGAGAQCPGDAKSTAECRGAAGECDVAESCDGVADDCPADGFVPDGTSCTDPDTCQLDSCSAGECTAGAIPWSGVLQPINQDGSSIFKLGSTIPVKFRLTNECANVSLVAKIYLTKVGSGVSGSELEATSTSAADTGNTFRWSDGQFIYNLATKPLSAGTWRIRIDLGDGVHREVLISLKK